MFTQSVRLWRRFATKLSSSDIDTEFDVFYWFMSQIEKKRGVHFTSAVCYKLVTQTGTYTYLTPITVDMKIFIH